MAYTYKVSYLDSVDEDTVDIGHGGLVAIERRWPKKDYPEAPIFESTAYAVFRALGGDIKDEAAFDTFLDRVDDIVLVPTKEAAPFPQEATDDS